MLRNMILLGLLLGVSAAIPLVYQSNPEAIHALVRGGMSTGDGVEADTVSVVQASAAAASGSGRKVEIAADERGHFTGAFKINGRKVDALIDTGATAVAVNISTARRLGMHVLTSDLKSTVNTANGKARATVVQIDRIEIGRIVVNDVPAIVLEDNALGTTLVGMTFLNRLKKFEAEGKTLQLVQ